MPTLTHIQSLKAKHRQLDQAINGEAKRPLPDDQRVRDMKREKLKLKEEIERLQAH
jgi:hypothetical protein